jgi:hypothetical protein
VATAADGLERAGKLIAVALGDDADTLHRALESNSKTASGELVYWELCALTVLAAAGVINHARSTDQSPGEALAELLADASRDLHG